MATITDNFTGGRNTAIWDNYGSGCTDATNQIECTYTTGEHGIVSKVAYDLSEPGSVEVNFTKYAAGGGGQLFLCISPQYVTSGAFSTSVSDFYRWGVYSGSFYAQYRVSAGSTITIGGSGTPSVGAPNIYKIDLPSTGNDVRFIENSTEQRSDTTWRLPSRSCYFYVLMGGASSPNNEGDFDDFSATYTSAASATPKNRTFHGPFGSPVLTGPF